MLKQIITKEFPEQKKNFKIIDKLDPLLENFINEINKSKDVTTIYSCEGHEDNEGRSIPYLFFNISEEVWDDFWSIVIPEISNKYMIHILTSDGYIKGISIYYEYRDPEDFWELLMETFNNFFF